MKRRTVLYLIAAVLLIMTAVFFVLFNKPHRSVKGVKAAFELSASELTEAFSSDESKADSMYTGKVIQVSGRLRRMIANDSTLILVMGDDMGLAGVSCYLEKGQIPKSEKLAPGDSITVKGICNGMLMDVILDNAILVKHEQ